MNKSHLVNLGLWLNQICQDWGLNKFVKIKFFWLLNFVLIQKFHCTKLESHSVECIFLGYNDESKVYMLMKKGSQQVFYSRNVIYHKNSTFLSISTMLEVSLEDVGN